MIIGVTGYGATGASAYIAFLKEFSDVQYYKGNFEFQLLQQPDGIRDLKFFLVDSKRRIGISTAINRFIRQFNYGRSNGYYDQYTNGMYKQLSNDYINSLISVRWKGKSVYDPQDTFGYLDFGVFRTFGGALRLLLRSINSDVKWPPDPTRFFADVNEQEFIQKTHSYLMNILKYSGFDLLKPILLEQLFSLNNPIDGGEYFNNDFKSIIVDRDPRDVFLLSNGYLADMCPFMPNKGNVKDFVKYYRGIHSPKINSDKVLYVNFEELIFDYDTTINKFESFLNLKHINKKKFFKPEWSINNTMVYKKYPSFSNEIKFIENNLSEYLYDFDSKISNINFDVADLGMFDETPGDKKRMIKKNKF